MTDQNVFMMVYVINVAQSIGEIFSIKISKDPFHVKVVDAVIQNGVNTILFDVVFLPPNVATTAPTATPNTVVEPNIVVATNLPVLPLFFAKSC